MIEREMLEKVLPIMRTLTDQVTATDAARQMGVSRKTLYQRINRVVKGAEAALAPRPAGRPAQERNPQVEYLLAQNTQLQREKLELEQRMYVREQLKQAKVENGKGTKKKAGVPVRGPRGGQRHAGHAGRAG